MNHEELKGFLFEKPEILNIVVDIIYNMSSKSNWFETSYNEYVEKYGGKWVLIMNNKVCFAYESFEKVYKEYQKVKEHPNTEMVLIDDGEASFYAIKGANEGNCP